MRRKAQLGLGLCFRGNVFDFLDRAVGMVVYMDSQAKAAMFGVAEVVILTVVSVVTIDTVVTAEKGRLSSSP